MVKSTNKHNLILITTVSLTINSWIISTITSIALSDTFKVRKHNQYLLIDNKNISQKSLLKTAKQNQSTWDKIVDVFTRERQKTSDMGGKDFCSISPNKTTSIIWSTQPLFAWKGTVKNIKVLRGGSDPATIWDYNLNKNDQKKQSILYNDDLNAKEKLNPGSIYYYSVTYQKTTEDGQTFTKTMKPPIRFELMKAQDRNKIQEELNQQNSYLALEETIIETAQFFGIKELFHDVVRVVFMQQGNSLEWDEKVQKLRDIHCE